MSKAHFPRPFFTGEERPKPKAWEERVFSDSGVQNLTSNRVAKRSRGDGRALAPGLCQGSPLRAEIEARAPDRLEEARQAALAALVRLHGDPVDAPMSVHIFIARA